MKKKIYTLLALIIFYLTPAFSIEIFNINFDADNSINMTLSEIDNSLTYTDTLHSETIEVFYTADEEMIFKEIAFTCKKLVKNIKTINEYKTNNIYNKLIELLKSKATEEYSKNEDDKIQKNTFLFTQNASKSKVSIIEKRTNTFSIWTFDEEINQISQNYFNREFPKYNVNIKNFNFETYNSKLDELFEKNSSEADIISLEDSNVRKYIEQGDKYFVDLTPIYEKNKDKLIKAPVQEATYDGKVYALSWLSVPGAVFYRRSLAKKYLGTDDPAEIQKYFSDWNNFLKTARIINKKSNGSCKIVCSYQDLLKPYLAERKQPWIVNEKLNIDPEMKNYLKLCKKMTEEKLIGKYYQWTSDWFEALQRPVNNGNEEYEEIFCYFFPTWGYHYIIKPNSQETSGDWGMIQGPVSWDWGGSWIAINKNSKSKSAAKKFIEFVCTNDEFLETYAKNTQTLVSNKNAINKVKDSFSDPFLNNQNFYSTFADCAENINGTLKQSNDTDIEILFSKYTNDYLDNNLTFEETIDMFTSEVNEQLELE